jgi:hypothetical protein
MPRYPKTVLNFPRIVKIVIGLLSSTCGKSGCKLFFMTSFCKIKGVVVWLVRQIIKTSGMKIRHYLSNVYVNMQSRHTHSPNSRLAGSLNFRLRALRFAEVDKVDHQS